MIEDAILTDEEAQSDNWEVFALFTDLHGAVLTTLPGEVGLAGTLELNSALCTAANEHHLDTTEISP